MRNFTCLALLVLSFSVSAQDFGLKGGINIGKEKSTDSGFSFTSDASVAFLAGFYADFMVSEQISLSPELIYHIDGGKYNFGSVSGRDKLSYLSVPLLLKYHATDRLNIHAGPQFGYLVDATAEINGQSISSTDGIKTINASFAFGGEVGFTSMSLGLRYVLGLSNLSDVDGSTAKVTLNTLQIYLGFPLN